MALKRIFKMSVVLTVIACGVLYGQRALVSAERPSAVDRTVAHQRSPELSLTMSPAEAMGMKRKMLLAQTTKNDPAPDNANTLPDAVSGASGTRTAQAAHDFCTSPDPIFDGVTPFSTLGNSTDGAAHLGAGCPFDGQTYADNWYTYSATCTGDMTASTCSDADYDTDIVVYDGCWPVDWGCPPGDAEVLGCNDDGAGCVGFTSFVTVGVTAGNCYTVRVGGWNSDADQGTGNITMSCVVVAACGDGTCDPEEDCASCPEDCGSCPMCGDCPTDVNGNGKTEAFDLAFLLGNWGSIPPDADPAVLCLDADGDGMIGAFDLAFLLGNWGQCRQDQKEGPFPADPAQYCMFGTSDLTVEIISTGQIIELHLEDAATLIAASAPHLDGSRTDMEGTPVPVPPPLPETAPEPLFPPAGFNLGTCEIHMQVVSMIMTDGESNLLIGLPYANGYPDIFFDPTIFVGDAPNAASFGEMEAERPGPCSSTGFPARSYFDVFHILETPVGIFFNKQFSQMVLAPADGHLALELPPFGHQYDLINDPIELFDVDFPDLPPVARIVAAHHKVVSLGDCPP